MRLAITGGDGQEHVVEFSTQPSDADIDEVAASFKAPSAPAVPKNAPVTDMSRFQAPGAVTPKARPAARTKGNGDPLGDPAVTGERVGRPIVGTAPSPAPVQGGARDFFNAIGHSAPTGVPDLAAPHVGLEPLPVPHANGKTPARGTLNAVIAQHTPAPVPTVWNGQKWKDDPFRDLPFTQHDFQVAVNDPTQAVKLKSGGVVTFGQAAAAVSKHTGVSDFKPNQSQADIEEAYTSGLGSGADVGKTVGFSKGQTDAQVPKGGAQKDQIGRTQYKGLHKITPSERVRDQVNAYTESASKALQSAGLPEPVAGLLASIPFHAMDIGADMQTVADPQESTDTILGAAENVTGKLGLDLATPFALHGLGKLAEPIVGPLGKRVVAALKQTDAWSLISESRTPAEAVKAVTDRWHLPEPHAKAIIEAVEQSGEPVNWNAEADAVANSPRNSGKTAKPSASEQTAHVAGSEPSPSILSQIEAVPKPEAPIEAVKGATPKEPVSTNPGDPNVTGLAMAQRSSEAERLGLREPESVHGLTNPDAQAQGKAWVSEGNDAAALLKRLSDEGRAAKPEEVGAFLEQRRQLVKKLMATQDALDAAKGTDGHAAALEAHEANVKAVTEFDRHLDVVKGASGQSLQSLKIGTTLDEGQYANLDDFKQAVRAEAERVAGGPLRDKAAAQGDKDSGALFEAHQRIKQLEAERQAEKVERTVRQGKAKAPQTLEQIQARRATALQNAAQAWKETGEAVERELAGQANSFLPGAKTVYKKGAQIYKVAPHVLEYAKTLSDEGVLRAPEVIAKVREAFGGHGIDLSDDDVKSILTNTYDRPKSEPRSRTAAEQQVKAWREEINGAKKAELDAKKDLDRFAKEVRGKHQTQMRQEARAKAQETLASKRKEYETLFGERNRLDKSIQDLQGKIDSGDFGGKPKFERDPELEKAYYERDRLRQKVKRHVEAQRPRTVAQKIGTVARDVINAPRTLKTSFDLSAPLRQGAMLSLANPGKAAHAFAEQLRAFKSPSYAHSINEAILRGDSAHIYKRAGLFLSDSEAGGLNGHEEAFISRLAGKVPGVAGSERAYSTYLNVMRSSVFDAMIQPGMSKAEERAIANYVNIATGRGHLPGFETSSNALAQLLFSPRYLTSRFEVLTLQPILSAGLGEAHSARVSGLIGKEYAKYAGVLGSMVALAHYGFGADLDADTTSSDFGKLRVGDTRIDVLSGLQQSIVFLSRLAQGKKTSANGNVTDLANPDFGGKTRGDLSVDFVRSKLAPAPGYLGNSLYGGKNAIGQPMDAADTAKDTLTPLIVNDTYEAIRANGWLKGLALGAGSGLGLGVSTYGKEDPPKFADAAYDWVKAQAGG